MLAIDGQAQNMRTSRPKYCAPVDVKLTDLHSILAAGKRGDLGPKQMTLLDRGQEKALPIYLSGHEDLLEHRSIAVIGTREASDLGMKRAHRFARELVENDIVVVSGLAAGIDTYALRSAISAGGRVIAVIGTPLTEAYPAANARLQEDIYSDHLLLSQFEPGFRVYPSNFPARNRTMAAISDASVIIEASETSGTLHQAAECQRLGRWLGITRGVVDDPRLEWPKRFLTYEKCIVLEDTRQFIETVYG